MIRKTEAHEASCLKELALQSKAGWGYSSEFMEACVAYFRLTPEILEQSVSSVLESDHIEGFYSVLPRDEQTCFLDYFFVSIDDQGKGVGSQLWEHMIALLRSHGFRSMDIEADQHAVAFYEKKGARVYAREASSIDPNYDVVFLNYEI